MYEVIRERVVGGVELDVNFVHHIGRLERVVAT